ncbi:MULTISPECIES: hypothetical protein [Dactylosporangium]|uniref:Integral membrane protein n=1 Tax=Dactylosporangium vinaceum TaxID=53362 RepID=A0ABV5LZH7_9ACTN|nr:MULTISPECIES: hypothetical protein [Dactylosporangium]UAB92604.1 hypothetical protein Dvina_30195 [Dactylosporangium vinaceum]UWZ41054.1 hypothetical protein Dmats_25380 [Dactylosporangium matsuzakiense]
MTKVLLSIHVLAAIIAIGPVTVAASMFPAVARRGDGRALGLLHRICRVYSTIAVAVPVFGLATASSLGVLGDAWLLTSIALTVLAAALLGLAILPRQRRLIDDGGDARRLGMLTGVFNLLWAVVVVLMIVRPGSTTGV